MRKIIIAGNWKMNTDSESAIELVKSISAGLKAGGNVEVVVCPPYISLESVGKMIQNTPIKLGAQDVHFEDAGAYTGKISVGMLKSAGVDYVILGHSEPRTLFGETDENVNKKVKKVIEAGLTPIICVGETLEQRESDITEKIVETQIKGAYAGVSVEDAYKTVIAYEPVWAIGTGKTATSDQAQEVHLFIRNLLASIYSTELSQAIQIQYGGSMKPDNAGDLLSKPDVDGGLIGGASLKADSFIGIIEAKS